MRIMSFAKDKKKKVLKVKWLKRDKGWTRRRAPHSPWISPHIKFMDQYVFCDDIVFNNMSIYTYHFLHFFVFYAVLECFAVFWLEVAIMFGCIIAPPGGHSRYDSSCPATFPCTEGNRCNRFYSLCCCCIDTLYSCYDLFLISVIKCFLISCVVFNFSFLFFLVV